jgi:hypothetical protein
MEALLIYFHVLSIWRLFVLLSMFSQLLVAAVSNADGLASVL